MLTRSLIVAFPGDYRRKRALVANDRHGPVASNVSDPLFPSLMRRAIGSESC
jgi:hypothetical protein